MSHFNFQEKIILFTALLNRGAANNLCYPPADCQQREIILLSPALEFYHSAVEFYHPAHRKITINGLGIALAIPEYAEIGRNSAGTIPEQSGIRKLLRRNLQGN